MLQYHLRPEVDAIAVGPALLDVNAIREYLKGGEPIKTNESVAYPAGKPDSEGESYCLMCSPGEFWGTIHSMHVEANDTALDGLDLARCVKMPEAEFRAMMTEAVEAYDE